MCWNYWRTIYSILSLKALKSVKQSLKKFNKRCCPEKNNWRIMALGMHSLSVSSSVNSSWDVWIQNKVKVAKGTTKYWSFGKYNMLMHSVGKLRFKDNLTQHQMRWYQSKIWRQLSSSLATFFCNFCMTYELVINL